MGNLVTQWIINCLPWRSELMAYLEIPRPPCRRFRRRSASFPNCGKGLFIWRFTTWIWAVLFCSWPRRSRVFCCECTVSSRTPTFLRDLSHWFAWTVFISAPEWLQFPDRNVSRGDKWASGPCVALIICVLGAERLCWSLPAPGQARPASRDGGNAGIFALGWATAHVWGCQTFSVKGQVINISGFVGFAGLYHNTHSTLGTQKQMQTIHKYVGMPCSNKPKIWISCDLPCHMILAFFWLLSNPLKV